MSQELPGPPEYADQFAIVANGGAAVHLRLSAATRLLTQHDSDLRGGDRRRIFNFCSAVINGDQPRAFSLDKIEAAERLMSFNKSSSAYYRRAAAFLACTAAQSDDCSLAASAAIAFARNAPESQTIREGVDTAFANAFSRIVRERTASEARAFTRQVFSDTRLRLFCGTVAEADIASTV